MIQHLHKKSPAQKKTILIAAIAGVCIFSILLWITSFNLSLLKATKHAKQSSYEDPAAHFNTLKEELFVAIEKLQDEIETIGRSEPHSQSPATLPKSQPKEQVPLKNTHD